MYYISVQIRIKEAYFIYSLIIRGTSDLRIK